MGRWPDESTHTLMRQQEKGMEELKALADELWDQ
jgi:hypothetical protein